MNEDFDGLAPDCARAATMLPEFADGELPAERSAWLSRHLEGCPECRAASDRFLDIDRELMAWGRQVDQADRPRPATVGSHWIRWIPAAAAIAAAAVLAWVAPHRAPPPGNGGRAEFVGIPYQAPLDPRENTAIVHMNIRVAALLAAGYRVNGDPGEVVAADVLVGEDGHAYAVRVLSGTEWNGTGEQQ